MIDIKVLASSSKGNCYRISDGKTPLLLEAGIPWKQIQQGLNFRTSEVAGCLLSHFHGDHSRSIKDVIKAGLDCYMSQGTQESLGVSGHRVNAVEALRQFVLGSWTILPFPTVHDAEGSLGFLMANQDGDKLVFITDSMYCRYRFKNLTHVMIEANYSDDILRANVEAGTVPVELKNRLIKSHFSLANVKEFLKANDLSMVEGVWLIHLSDGNSDAERFRREVMELAGKPVYV